MNRMRKGMAALLCALLVVGLTPTTAMAAVGIEEGTPAFTKKVTTVSFAGHEWWVIDTGADGVTNPGSGTITLLKKNGDFGDSAFRIGSSSDPGDGSLTYYPGDGWYYAGDFSLPSDYNDSTLMNVLATATDALPSKEAVHITARALDNIGGTAVNGQKLWPLSLAEYSNMGTITSDPYTSSAGVFWLRSPLSFSPAFVGFPGGGTSIVHYVTDPFVGVRPALNLNLASVLFTSDASGASDKSNAAAGGPLIGAAAPTQNLKFTMLDSSQTLDVIATTAQSTQSGGTITFGYANATAGPNQFISCVLVNNSDVVAHYGKLKDSSSTANGTISIPLAGVADGTYTLKIFSEEANGNTYTDFCSTPVEMTVEVTSGSGTVSNFGGTTLSNDTSLIRVAGQNITATGSGAAINDPKTASISVANSVSVIAASDIVAATDASVKLYADAAFTTEQNVNLNVGSGNTLYIQVTAQDGTIVYYAVTVNRAAAPLPNQHAITVTANPLAGGNPSASPVSAAQGTPVTLTANPAANYRFDGWTVNSGGASISNPSSATATFTMPDNAVSITANYTYVSPDPGPSDTTPPTIISIKATPYGSTGATLEVVATDASMPLSYQWQVKGSWIDIPGATSARFDYTGLEAGKSYTVRVKVTDAKGNQTISEPITFAAGTSAITGLPESYTLLVGQSVKWTPNPTGGSWRYDNDYLSMKKNGDQYRFTAKKVGKTTATYTAGGTEYVVQITINAATIPQTGDMSNPWLWICLLAASGIGLAVSAVAYKRRTVKSK